MGEVHPSCCSPDLSTQDTHPCMLRGLLQIQGVHGHFAGAASPLSGGTHCQGILQWPCTATGYCSGHGILQWPRDIAMATHCHRILQWPNSQAGLGHAAKLTGKGSRHDCSPRLHPYAIWGVPPMFPSAFFPSQLRGGGNVCLQEAGLWLNSPPVGELVSVRGLILCSCALPKNLSLTLSQGKSTNMEKSTKVTFYPLFLHLWR